jgi:hypothetical protein
MRDDGERRRAYEIVRGVIASTIQVVVHMERKDGLRSVRGVLEVKGYDADTEPIRVPRGDIVSEDGTIRSEVRLFFRQAT